MTDVETLLAELCEADRVITARDEEIARLNHELADTRRTIANLMDREHSLWD